MAKRIIALDGEVWYNHPDGDDLALCPIGLNKDLHEIDFVHTERWIDREFMTDIDIGLGEDVFSVGRFVNREGQQKNTPALRFGNISQMPAEPIRIGDLKQEAFLVEMRSISGYSGSPVFVNVAKYIPVPGIPKSKITKYGGLRVSTGDFLLGVNFCYIRSEEPVRNSRGYPLNDQWHVLANTGMAGVIPAWRDLRYFGANACEKRD